WKLNAQSKNHDDPWEELKKISLHRKMSVKDLFQDYRLSKGELQRNPLQELPFPG
ncbi:MAG: hypothetical protein QOJ16_4460, partial [Acidobacteriota bacterium]|nr:hypothetical protein [Acidobacteriota bacterium]